MAPGSCTFVRIDVVNPILLPPDFASTATVPLGHELVMIANGACQPYECVTMVEDQGTRSIVGFPPQHVRIQSLSHRVTFCGGLTGVIPRGITGPMDLVLRHGYRWSVDPGMDVRYILLM
jgi:hypothetical protein